MNLGTKRDLDALLEDWPASEQGDERQWEERADGIVKAALERKGASDAGLDTLLAAPDLAPEPGESGAMLFSGRKMMTEEKAEDGSAGIASPDTGTPLPVSVSAPPTERKRTSLKDITARASQSSARSSSPGAAPPSVAPARLSSNPPVSRSALSSVTPLPRPAEAGKEDSGVINLDVVRAAATPQQIAAAEAAVPGQQGLFENDKTVESAASPVQKVAAAKPPTPIAVVAAKKSNAGPIAGVAIAVLGIAAAFAIIMKKPPAPIPVAEVAPTVAVAPLPKVAATPSAAPQPSAEATAVASAEASAAPSADPKAAEPGRLAVAPVISGGAAVKDPTADGKLATAKSSAPATTGAPVATGAPGDLASEMARAAGGTKAGDKDAVVAVPEPAAARNQNIPEKPSQGSVQAAVGAVAGSAKSCVAGADEISHATVTFSGAGNVSSVSVSGWAAAHGKSACVQAAMKAAKVGPFSSSSFTVSVPIRP